MEDKNVEKTPYISITQTRGKPTKQTIRTNHPPHISMAQTRNKPTKHTTRTNHAQNQNNTRYETKPEHSHDDNKKHGNKFEL